MVKVIESLLIEAGITPLAGVDEAGRGACAGPLVIASVVLADPFAPELAKVRDSKDVSEPEREKLFDLVTSLALSISVITVPSAEVDSRGVHAANLDGMRRAVQGLSVTPSYVLTDGYAIEGLAIPNVAVWKGDQVVTCISAASIIAKVARDAWMSEHAHERFPMFGFANHKGYGTQAHRVALHKYGPTVLHRHTFLSKVLAADPWVE